MNLSFYSPHSFDLLLRSRARDLAAVALYIVPKQVVEESLLRIYRNVRQYHRVDVVEPKRRLPVHGIALEKPKGEIEQSSLCQLGQPVGHRQPIELHTNICIPHTHIERFDKVFR